MKVLVVGGTGFLGGAIARRALECGHSLSVMTRGNSSAIPAEGAEWIKADRYGDLSVLEGRDFDLVADTCTFEPGAVEALLKSLGKGAGRYAMVSSISVYADFGSDHIDELSATSRATEEQWKALQASAPDQRGSAAAMGDAYGAMKREAELAAISLLGDRALILRAGLLVGAGDYTDRFTYWVRRVDMGGVIAAPGSPLRPVQLIDVRDAAAFIIAAAEQGVGGIFNLTSRAMPFTQVLEAVQSVAQRPSTLRWIGDETIVAAGVKGWEEMTLWLPQSDVAWRNFLNVNVDRAINAGLATRPIVQIVSDLLAWDRQRRGQPLKAGLTLEQEALLLAS